jgi:hypothetical protein
VAQSTIADAEEVKTTIVVTLHHHHRLLSSEARVGWTAFAQVGFKVVIPQRFLFVSRCVFLHVNLLNCFSVPCTFIQQKSEKKRNSMVILATIFLCL